MSAARGFLVLTLPLVLSGCLGSSGVGGDQPRQERLADRSGVAYGHDADCAACHTEQASAWAASHHDLAMQPATSATVLGDFDDATLTHAGVTSRFFRRAGAFFVNTEGPDGTLTDFELTYTLGVEPLQQYLAPFPGGRLQSLPIAWDTERDTWFHLYPEDPPAPADPLHWTGRYQTWNVMCAACHSTDLRKHYDPDADVYSTTWAEIDVGCQACHGPGTAHLAWAEDGADPGADLGLTTRFGPDAAATEFDSCAPCHSRREELTPIADHAGALLDDYRPATLAEGLYHPDGQILDEVYVYGSFVQSKMHAAGVRCSNCHDPHSLELRTDGNALCTQCHRNTAVEAFPTLTPAVYDTPSHHHHAADSPGSQCVNCHMPERTYMVVDPRRDHSFRVPRPDLSEALGTPNACTACHNEGDAWAAAAVAAWSPDPPAPHFGPTLAAGRAGAPDAGPALAALVDDGDQPAIVRATALELLRNYGQRGLDAARTALASDDPTIRATAAGGLASLAPPDRLALLAPLLEDPVRAVRIESAQAVAEAWAGDVEARSPALVAAAAELINARLATSDLPAARLSLGVIHERQGDDDLAEVRYRQALAMDPWFSPARFNLANLLNRQTRNADAEVILRDGLALTHDDGEMHYSLGLLLAEEERMDEAVPALEQAARLTDRARVRYNLGLALQQMDRLDDAERELRSARELDATDPDILLALTRLLMTSQRWGEAREMATALVQLRPMANGPQQLLNEIQVRERRSR